MDAVLQCVYEQPSTKKDKIVAKNDVKNWAYISLK